MCTIADVARSVFRYYDDDTRGWPVPLVCSAAFCLAVEIKRKKKSSFWFFFLFFSGFPFVSLSLAPVDFDSLFFFLLLLVLFLVSTDGGRVGVKLIWSLCSLLSRIHTCPQCTHIARRGEQKYFSWISMLCYKY